MILALDVHYEELAANTACVGLRSWPDASSTLEVVERIEEPPAPYESGQFYKRELPHLHRVIERIRCALAVEVVIIDGHVWLGATEPGLGAHLHDALGGQIPVVGVAKSAFHGALATPVLRGESGRPLFVSAVAFDASRAAELVRDMHGAHRVPTLLQRADQLARRIAAPDLAKSLVV
ncbi:MAG: endonuclease V [Kofleriaceae bacterium]